LIVQTDNLALMTDRQTDCEQSVNSTWIYTRLCQRQK